MYRGLILLQTIVLALLQSITEFLPISSSGHLILLPFLLKWKPQGIAADIGLHLGTLLAVVVYFRADIYRLVRSCFSKKQEKGLLINLVIASVPIAVFGLCFLPVLRSFRYNHVLIAIMLIIFGVVLWLADKCSSMENKKITIKKALFIGFAQCLSLIPGVSRSGITITAARLCKIDRTEATHFSMLLSIPTISMAGLWVLYKSFIQNNSFNLDLQFMLGLFYSFVFGLLVIFVLMRFVKNHSFFIFMLYRMILGFLILRYILL